MLPASFRGIPFKVEQNGLAGGRRNVVFEFPKRDIPFAEDMGRRARHWSITGFVIGATYTASRDALIAALETESAGSLVLPTGGTVQAVCETFETEETVKGGICTFKMHFTEAGSLAGTSVAVNTAAAASVAASALSAASAASLNASATISLSSGTITLSI